VCEVLPVEALKFQPAAEVPLAKRDETAQKFVRERRTNNSTKNRTKNSTKDGKKELHKGEVIVGSGGSK